MIHTELRHVDLVMIFRWKVLEERAVAARSVRVPCMLRHCLHQKVYLLSLLLRVMAVIMGYVPRSIPPGLLTLERSLCRGGRAVVRGLL